MQGGSLDRLSERRWQRKHRQLLQLRHVQPERGRLCSLSHSAIAFHGLCFTAAVAMRPFKQQKNNVNTCKCIISTDYVYIYIYIVRFVGNTAVKFGIRKILHALFMTKTLFKTRI